MCHRLFAEDIYMKNKQDRQCAHNVTFRRLRATTVAVEKQYYYILWVCVCSLRYPSCNARDTSVACPAVKYFSTFYHKWDDFRENIIEHKKCVLIFSTNLPEKMCYSKIHMTKMYIGIHVKYPLFISDFNEILMLSTYFRKLSKYSVHENLSNGSQVVPRGRAYGETDRRIWRS